MGKSKKKSKSKSNAESGEVKGQTPETENVSGNEPTQEADASEMHFDHVASKQEVNEEENTKVKEETKWDADNDFRELDSNRFNKRRGNARESYDSKYKGYKESDYERSTRGKSSHDRKSEPNKRSKYNEEAERFDKRRSLNENAFSKGMPRDNSNSRRKRRSDRYQDEEFILYEKEFDSQRGNTDFLKTKEIVNDLFEMPEDYSLAHCVAEDMNMGSGIAVQFRRDFKRVSELLNQHQPTGGLALLTTENRYIYYLVTKRFSTGKPTYETLFSSLKCLREHVRENGVKKIAMPRIGCGLDRLDWENVKFMIEFIFQDVDVEIVVCNLEPTEESPQQRHKNCKVSHETYPIEKIDSGTVILYFSSEDEFVSDEMKKLDEKFPFLREFNFAKKSLGNVVFYSRTANYLLCGCIVKKSKTDPFDFVAFQKCLSAIQKENRKSQLYYYAFQAMKDQDSCLNYKIINILRNTLRDVEVYVCWPGDLQDGMSPRDRFSDERSSTVRTSSARDSDNWRSKNDRDFVSTPKTTAWDRNVPRINEKRDRMFTSTITQEPNMEANYDWFQNSEIDEALQNSSFGSLPQTETYYWSENDSEFGIHETQQNYSRNLDQTESEQGEAQASTFTAEQMDSSGLEELSTTVDSEEWDNLSQNLHQSVTVEKSDDDVNQEYEKFKSDLSAKNITALKESAQKLTKSVSRVCYASEDFAILSGVPPGPDISPSIGTLLNQRVKAGGLAFVKEGDNFLYCLIISQANAPPTSLTVFSAFQKLRDHASRYGVRRLLVPTVDISGGDFKWSDVKYMLQFLLGKSQVEISLSAFPNEYDSRSLMKKNKNKIQHVKCAMYQMKKKSALLYLASSDGTFTEEMTTLAKNFGFSEQFTRKNKHLGSMISYAESDGYILYGCIVKRQHTDAIDFEMLRKCMSDLNEENKKEKLPYVGIQALNDQTEGINAKIATVFLHSLQNVTIMMCWPGDLRSLMP